MAKLDRRTNALSQITMQRTMRPVLWMRTEARVHGGEIDHIPMPLHICGVAYLMFPIPPLPDAFLSTLDLRKGTVRGHRHLPQKSGFHHTDPVREIVITRWQGPDCVDHGRQDANSIDRKGMTRLRGPHRSAQAFNPGNQQVARAIRETDGEKVTRTLCAAADIG